MGLAEQKGIRMEMQEELRDGANRILATLEGGDVNGAYKEVQRLLQARDLNLYREIGRITRGLHDALASFSADAARTLGRDADGAIEESPRERLRYVTELTADAANRTMDLVEGTQPHAQRLHASARDLVEFLDDPELNIQHVRRYCRDSAGIIRGESDAILGNLRDILVAQDFQDLSGQIIHRVIRLLQQLEDELVQLVARCAEVEQATGAFAEHDEGSAAVVPVDPLRAEGPVVPAAGREDVVRSQDEVDDLLSSLGF
jgi:chemotaxis protein CheZ